MKYKRADNCGPVPYPDGSGRLLMDETVEGDEWEALVPLGFVVRAQNEPGKHLPDKKAKVSRQTKGPRLKAGRPKSTNMMAKGDILNTNNHSGAPDAIIDDRDRASGMDQAAAGGPGVEGSAESGEAK